MKRALVTGSAGLIGRHMSAELSRRGWSVECVDLKPGQLHDARDYFRHGVRSYHLVVHCAAHVGGRADIDGRPTYLAAVNLQLDGALFEWALRTRPDHLVYWSSSAAYPVSLQHSTTDFAPVTGGPGAARPRARMLRETDIDLDDPALPDASYGAVKLVGEQLARWAEAEGLRVHVFRPFSGYAADQDPSYPFRAFADRARRRADPFDVWGTGEQIRDWIHIDDVVAAALAAVEQDHRGPLNLCSGTGISFNQLATMMCRQAGYMPELCHHPDAPTGVAHRVGDPTEMLRIYRPLVPLDEGIARALAAPP